MHQFVGVYYFMPAAYDTYDYPSYWEGREYEHSSEIIALKSLLQKIPKIKTVLEIGAGYGRLTPTYLYRGKKIILSDPSLKLLGLAKKEFKQDKKIKLIQSKAENLANKIRTKSIDLAVMVRVIHHLKDPGKVFKIIHKTLKPGGYFILEFANKRHGKAVFQQICKGNLTFLLDIFPKDIRSKKHKKKKTLPFINYHPDNIIHMLEESGFKLVEKRSVSNIRSDHMKRWLTPDTLIKLEETLQKPLSCINFGPSIFLLLRKKG